MKSRAEVDAEERAAIVDARARKVRRLVAAAQEHGITAEVAARLDEQGRVALAGLAGVRRPSWTTWALVVGRLEQAEKLRDDPVARAALPSDPFEGLAP